MESFVDSLQSVYIILFIYYLSFYICIKKKKLKTKMAISLETASFIYSSSLPLSHQKGKKKKKKKLFKEAEPRDSFYAWLITDHSFVKLQFFKIRVIVCVFGRKLHRIDIWQNQIRLFRFCSKRVSRFHLDSLQFGPNSQVWLVSVLASFLVVKKERKSLRLFFYLSS